ncbi:MAG: hypothetical protein WB994_01870 [Candidatus Acidiferrum sp.]
MKLLTRGRVIAALGIIGLGVVLVARGKTSPHPARVGVPHDWSHRQVVFSRPATISQAIRIQKEPRYWQQIARRSAAVRWGGGASGEGFDPSGGGRFHGRHHGSNIPLSRDWAESLGSGASTGNATFPQFPAKYSYDISETNESCSDYVVYPTNVPGVTGTSTSVPGQASIIAYQNLYAGPGGTGACGIVPTIAWAYNTNGAGDPAGVVSASPVLSMDGTKVAFVESNVGGSFLRLLSYKVGEGADPTGALLDTAAPTHLLTSGSGWNACPSDGSSCMISLTFGTATAINSSPFYDFGTDELYVGDDAGVLHKFTGVFNGTPTEVTAGWPITVDAGAILTPPVFDAVSGNAFVGDSKGVLSYVRDTGSTTGICATGVPPCLGSTTVLVTDGSVPVVDSPMLDPTTGKVFAFVGDSGVNSTTVVGVARASYVVQANMDLTGKVFKGVGSFGAPLHSGAFDNLYLNSSPPTITGFLYVCGKTPAIDRPTLRRIAFGPDGTLGTVGLQTLQVGGVAGAAGQCSPITEIFNPNVGPTGTDFLFFSAQSGGQPVNCAGIGNGCVMSTTVTGGTFPSSIAASLAEAGGTSGIVIDNVGTFGQDSSLYFSRLAQSQLGTCGGAGSTLVGCAVKLTQSGLN